MIDFKKNLKLIREVEDRSKDIVILEKVLKQMRSKMKEATEDTFDLEYEKSPLVIYQNKIEKLPNKIVDQ